MNVIDTSSLAHYISARAGWAMRPELSAWIKRVLPKHIKRSEQLLLPVLVERQIREEYPAKKDKAVLDKLLGLMRTGTRFYVFDAGGVAAGELGEEVRRVVDWLDSVPEWDRHLRRIDRMSFTDAMKLSSSWHERLLALSADADDPDVVEEKSPVMEFPDGCKFYRLEGPVALLREGMLMGHCVGGKGYVDNVLSGNTGIFSLRDTANRPHVTIEVHRGKAVQIKGKGNRSPIETWAAKAREFVIAGGWGVSRDGNAIGLVTLDSRTFGDPVSLVDYLVESDRDLSKGLRNVLPDAVVRSLVARTAELPVDRKALLAKKLASTPIPSPTLEAVVIEGPGGRSIARYRHVIPAALTDALVSGMLAGAEEAIASEIGNQLDEAFSGIRQNLAHLHIVDVGNTSADKGLLDRLAAFSGRGEVLRKLRADVNEARRKSHSDIVVAIRKETSVTGRQTTKDGRSWAAEWSRLPQVSPEGVEKMRVLNPGMSFL